MNEVLLSNRDYFRFPWQFMHLYNIHNGNTDPRKELEMQLLAKSWWRPDLALNNVKPCVKVCLSQVTSKTASRIEEHQAELHERILNKN